MKVIDEIGLELYHISKGVKSEEELILSGTTGELYSAMQNFVLLNKPKDEE